MVENGSSQDMGTPAEGVSLTKRVSWAAVLAGVVVVLVVQLSLSLLGIGIGASTIDPLSERNPVQGIGTGSGIWLVVSTLLALFAGGWVAGRLSGMLQKFDGSLHGVLAWGLATILTFYFLSSAVGGIISGSAQVISRGVSALSQGISSVAPQVADAVGNQLEARGIDLSSIKQEATQILRQTGKPELQPGNIQAEAQQAAGAAQDSAADVARNPGDASQELNGLIDRIFAQGRTTLDAADRDAMINVLTARTQMTREQAGATVDRWQTTFQSAQAQFAQAREQAAQTTREAADTTARAVSKAALWGFVALLLGGFAAGFGGYLGSLSNLKFPFSSARSGVQSGRPAFHA